MFAYSINQTNPENKRTYILQRHFNANNTLEGGHLHLEHVHFSHGKTLQRNIYEIIIKYTKFINE